MDCCCKQDQSIITQYSVNNGNNNGNTNINTQNIPKLKYSFRTQQATPHQSKINTINTMNATNYQTRNTNNNNNTLHNTSSLVHNYSSPKQQKMHSTVASNNELLQLQRQRQQLINQDRQLDVFYQTRIVPLQKEVQFFEHQVQVRNIQIMELQDLLSQRVKEKQSVENVNQLNQQHNLNNIQSNVVNHTMLRGQGNQHLPVIQNINLNQNNVPMRPIVPVVQQQQQQSVHVQQRHNIPGQHPQVINHQQVVPQNIKVIRQSIILPQQQNIHHQINKPTVVNSQVVIRPQHLIRQ